MWVFDPAFITEGDWVVKDVVHLDDAIVRVGPVCAWHIIQHVAGPADLTLARSVFELAVDWAVALVVLRCVVD